ncbi:SGNH/GDSL hydrolase family protein [Niveibacterium sp. SC-1]|uniref:SGNH/GDSL hydrolase family protein n=1 Tax=Niveibacterium sp. SC-1 TaxID=3135646 RepID=UPI0031202CD5
MVVGRSRLLAALCAALSLLWGCGGGSDGSGQPMPGTSAPIAGAPDASAPVASVPAVAPGTWAVIGSSSAAGAGAPDGQGWAAQLRSAYAAQGVTVRNLAVGGTVTYQALPTGSPVANGRPATDPSSNVTAALATGARLVLVSFPTNDTALGYSVSETVGNLRTIRAAALDSGVAVMLLSAQPRDLSTALLARMPELDAQLAAMAGDCFVPVREALAGADGKLSPLYDSGDGVHPNAAGHAVIADRVKSVIEAGKCVRLG